MPLPARSAPAPAAGPAVVDVSDLRAVLTQLAILAGANDHLLLLQAQSADTAVVLRQGTADLAALAAAAPAALQPDGQGGWRATRPLVVWQGATLRLGATDRLSLSTEDGAFLLVFGQLQVDGASLARIRPANPRSPAFRPFLLAAGSAELHITRAHFSALGMDRAGLFGGVTLFASGLFPPATPPFIGDSRFDGVAQVSLRQTRGAVVAGNRFAAGGGLQIVGGSHLI